MSSFLPFEVVGRCRETQPQMGENVNKISSAVNLDQGFQIV